MTTAEDIQNEYLDTLNDDNFGESITYTASGIDYSIKAFVYRNGISSRQMRYDRGTESKQSRFDVEIRISNMATYGRQAITLKEDNVTFEKDIGSGKDITMRVIEITDQDQGSWRLGLSV